MSSSYVSLICLPLRTISCCCISFFYFIPKLNPIFFLRSLFYIFHNLFLFNSAYSLNSFVFKYIFHSYLFSFTILFVSSKSYGIIRLFLFSLLYICPFFFYSAISFAPDFSFLVSSSFSSWFLMFSFVGLVLNDIHISDAFLSIYI